MRYKRAVEKLRILAETCERVKTFSHYQRQSPIAPR
jgi:hypothetical protein